MNDGTTRPPNHPSLSLSQHGHETMTCRSIQRVFCGDHPTPGLGTLGLNLVVFKIDGRDGLVNLQRLSQGLEAATDQGWRLVPELYRSKAIYYIPENT